MKARCTVVSVLDTCSRRVLGFVLGEGHDALWPKGHLATAIAVRGGQVPSVVFRCAQMPVSTCRQSRFCASAGYGEQTKKYSTASTGLTSGILISMGILMALVILRLGPVWRQL